MEPDNWRKQLSDSDQRLEELRHAMEIARRQFDQAKITFDEVARNAHNIGFGHPDGALGLRRVAMEYNFLLKKYAAALADFNDFVLHRSRIKK